MSAAVASTFQRLTQGVYVVGVADGATRNAFTAAWIMQASFDPVLLVLSINPHHSSYEVLKRGQAFSVNVLDKNQLQLAAHFGQPAGADKLATVEWETGITGTPLLRGALAWFECRVAGEYPAGDHTLVLGKVVNAKLRDASAEPLTYRDTGTLDGAAALYPRAFEKPC